MKTKVGFRFDPRDETLINFLKNKVKGHQQRRLNHFVVKDCEVYGEIPPWEIYDSHTHYHLHTFGRKLFVFANLKTTGNRVCRAASCGTWLAKSKPRRILDSQGNLIGIDRMLNFKAKDHDSGKFNKTNWIMHEFSLANQESPRTNTVLCVIYKQNKGSDYEEANGRVSTAAAEEVSSFNTTAVMSLEQEESQAQQHRKRLCLEPNACPDADVYTHEELVARLDHTSPDEALSQIFSDLPPLVELCSQSESDPVAYADLMKRLLH